MVLNAGKNCGDVRRGERGAGASRLVPANKFGGKDCTPPPQPRPGSGSGGLPWSARGSVCTTEPEEANKIRVDLEGTPKSSRTTHLPPPALTKTWAEEEELGLGSSSCAVASKGKLCF